MIKIVQGPNFISTLEMFKNFLPVFDQGLFASCSISVTQWVKRACYLLINSDLIHHRLLFQTLYRLTM